MYDRLRPLLFALDAERAHGLTLRALDWSRQCGASGLVAAPPADFPVQAFGLNFPNPVGLAAGLDKNGAHIDALATLGFGFLEVGTVTPRPQAGNAKPRLFRLPEDQAIINRFGFNNDGVNVLVAHVERSRYEGILGINIGKNADTPNEHAAEDYLYCLRAVYPCASYITVNISSPNTRGLRDLQAPDALQRFIKALLDERAQLATRFGRRKPLLLKIAPDLDEPALDAMAEVLRQTPPDGLICTNTTLDRSLLGASRNASESGGLSGRPLRSAADRVLQGMHERLGDALPLVGVGGIMEGDDAAEKFRRGAQLVQLYTGLIYRGPQLVAECGNELARQFGDDA